MDEVNGLKKMGMKKGGATKRDPSREKRRKQSGKLKDLPGKKKKLTPQERREILDKIKKRKGQMTNPFIKLDSMGRPMMEAKKGGLAEATAKLKAQGLKKGGFPDLSGDGKVTMKDILMGRGVVKKPKKKAMGGSMTLGGKGASKVAGRLAKRGYGAAKK